MNSREQFEKWAVSKRYSIQKTEGMDQYASLTTEFCWASWQASRECIEVDLPPLSPRFEPDIGYDSGIAACKEALEAQGIKVK